MAEIARYTATDAIALGLARSFPQAALKTQGRALFE